MEKSEKQGSSTPEAPLSGMSSISTKRASKSANLRSAARHAKPLALGTIDLNKPGRLRVGHLMSLLAISHATLYARLRGDGVAIPQPDGKDGRRPYWKTSTIRNYLGD